MRSHMSLLVLVCTLLLVPGARAQSTTATLNGQILDTSGAAVPDASVVAVNDATGLRYPTQTNREGIYLLPNLPPGTYHLEISKTGFKFVMQHDLVLHVQDARAANFTLQVGASSETITVEAGGATINTTDATVSTTVDRNFAENLPMNGRTFQSLIYLTPGVTLNMGAPTNYTLGQFSVNGQRASSNYWTVDGVSANIGTTPWYTPTAAAAGGLGGFNALGGTNSLVSVDALQEFRIETSTYAPEFGRTPGGQITIVTRSGTNTFHGTAFDYLRNGVLDSTDWFANRNHLPKAAEKQNDFGGVLGGPFIKNKTFFFFSYEGLRLRQPQIVQTTVPDLDARQNAVAAMQPWINAYPLPNPGVPDIGPGFAPFNATFTNPSTVNAYSLRLDHQLTNSLNLFARYNHSPSSLSQRTSADTSANNIFDVGIITKTATAGATWTKSAQTVNDVRFNYSVSGGATGGHMDDFDGGTIAPAESLFPSGVTYANGAFSLYPFAGTNMSYFEGHNAGNVQHQYNVVDTLSTQKGSHSLKFGADYRHLSPRFAVRSYSLYAYFADVASMEAGIPAYTETVSSPQTTFIFNNLGVYAQDTWRANQRLSLTYGVRWDVDFTPSTTDGPAMPTVTGFSYTDLSQLALAPPGRSIYNTRYGNFAPRVGAAYQLRQKPGWETVARGGFGVFYDLSGTEVGDANIYEGYPYTVFTINYTAPFPTPAAVAVAPAIIPPDATQGVLVGFDPHLNAPYSLQWSSAVQQSLGNAQSLTVTYLGSSGRRLLLSESATNPNPNYLSAFLIGNAGRSNYNALQVQFQRRLSRGVQALLSYSWSHSIDNGSGGGYTNGSFANVNANRGPSDFDIRKAFSGALTYEAPAFRRNSFTRAITHGWSLQNIVQVRSAPPVEVYDGAFALLGAGLFSQIVRPDVVPGQPLYLYGKQYPGGKALNPNAFTAPPVSPITGFPLRQGTLGRNAIRAFGLSQWDFAVHREFPIHEALKLQFRAEMFNVLNHPNFSPYNSTFGTGDTYFGQSTAMLAGSGNTGGGAAGNGFQNSVYALGGPRSIQLALKLNF